MRLNPVYKKELKLSVRSRKLPSTIVIYNGILALFSLLAFYTIFELGSGYLGMYGTTNYSSILSLYTAISVLQIVLVVFVVPSLTAGAIAGEREKQTLEILLTTKLTSGQIVRGKLAASISDLILVVFSSIPVMAIVFSIGGVDIKDLCQLILLIVVTAILAGSIGIFMSARFKKTMVATILTYSVILLFGLGYPIFLLLLNQIVTVNEWNFPMDVLGYVCLAHPGVTLVEMLMKQFGSADVLHLAFRSFGFSSNWVVDHWFGVSIAVQLVIAVMFLFFAQMVLNPIKKPKKRKTGREAASIVETKAGEETASMTETAPVAEKQSQEEKAESERA